MLKKSIEVDIDTSGERLTVDLFYTERNDQNKQNRDKKIYTTEKHNTNGDMVQNGMRQIMEMKVF